MDELGGFSNDDVSAILKRATELEHRPGAGQTWGLDQVEQVAVEAGISVDAVRRAAAERQLANLDTGLDLGPARRGIEPVVAARVVPGDPATVGAALRAYLADRGLTILRERPTATLWRAAKHKGNHSGSRLREATQISVVVVADAAGTGSVVRIRADLPGGAVTRAIRESGEALFTAAIVGWCGSSFLFDGSTVDAVGIGGGWLALGIGRATWGYRTAGQRRRDEISLEIQGALDRLELGQVEP